MQTIGYVQALFGFGVIVFIFLYFGYKNKNPSIFPSQKPGFSFLPKFSIQYTLHGLLNEKLAQLGYMITEETSYYIIFTKGTKLAELRSFKGQNMKLKLIFFKPLEEKMSFDLEYDTFIGVLFDTGDLWTVGKEIKDYLNS